MSNPSTPGFNKSAMQFGGARYLSIISPKLPTNNFTISFRFQGAGGTAVFYGYPNFNTYSDTTLTISIDGGVRVSLGNVDVGDFYVKLKNGASLLDNKVHYIAVTFKEKLDTGEVTLGIFVDGNMSYQAFTLISMMEHKPMHLSGPLYIATAPPRDSGHQNNAIQESDLFNGILTGFNLWKAVLTAAELVRDVATSTPIREDALCLSLPLDTDHYDFYEEAFVDDSPNKINARNNIMINDTQSFLAPSYFSNFPILSRTFETWIRCGIDSMGKTLLSYGDVSNSDHPNDGRDTWIIKNPESLVVNDMSTQINVADGQWHHIAIVTEVTPGADEWSNTGKDAVYLDGVLKYSGNSRSVGQIANQPFLIGSKNMQSSDDVFQGQLNQMKFWNVARTAVQILDSYQQGTVDDPNEAGRIPLNIGTVRSPKIINQLPNGILTASETPLITVNTDLMQNFKHAQVMGEQRAFQALQTAEGHALFFSIGTDNVFSVTIETPGHATGWNKINLSDSILQTVANKALHQPKMFKVAQNANTGAINIALMLGSSKGDLASTEGDTIYTAWNIPNTDASWNTALPWKYQKFDDLKADFSHFEIKDLYILESAHSDFMVVDINAPATANPFRRYFLDFAQAAGTIWQEHDLPFSFDDSVYSVIGKRAGDTMEGIYTLGAVVDRYKLSYTPLPGDTNTASTAIELHLPQPDGPAVSSYAIAVVHNSGGETDLFVAGNKQLFFFPSGQQQDGSTGQAVDLPLTNVLMNVTKLHVQASDQQVFVWGLNQQGRLFFTQCSLGQELQKQAWSTPSLILTDVSKATTYLNAVNQNHVLFAYNSSNQLLQLSQDPQTLTWSQRSILLPATATDDVVEVNSYTSHVVITDGSSLPKFDVKVAITATTPVSVYVNDIYTILSPSLPLNITTDPTGSITIIQETADLSAVCYRFSIEGIDPLLVNPMAGVLDTMKSIQTGDDLMKVRITDDNKHSIPLIDPTKVDKNTPDALAKVIQQLVDTLKYVPADGSKHKSSNALRTRSATSDSKPSVLWGLHFEKGGMTYYEGAAAETKFGSANAVALRGDSSIGQEIIDDIWSFFNWVKDDVSSLFDAIEHFVVEVVEGVVGFVFKILGKIFVFFIDTLVAAISAFMSFLDWVGVDTQKLRKWLGYIFDWDDILLTHRVFKKFFSTYIDQGIKSIESYENKLLDAMTAAEDYVKNWAGIEDRLPGDSEDSAKNTAAGINPVRGQNTPAFNMINYHLKNNAGSSNLGKDVIAPIISGDLGEKLKAILAAVELLKQKFEDLIKNTDSDFYRTVSAMSYKDIIVKIVGFVTSELLEIAKTILAELFKLFNTFLEGIRDVLTAPIEIPVLSHIYKKQITKGDDLSILDVACLVAAIPVTVVFKLLTGDNIFKPGPETDKLLNANDFSAFQVVLTKPDPSAPRSARTDSNASIVHSQYDNWVLASGIMAMVSAVAISVTTVFAKPYKKEQEALLPANPATIINSILALPYASPDIVAVGGLFNRGNRVLETWEGMNIILTSLFVGKAMVDVVDAITSLKYPLQKRIFSDISPWADLVINGLWNVPVIMSIFSPQNTNPAFQENIAGGFFFNFSGMLSPAISFDDDPDSLIVLLFANGVFNIIYGSVTVAASDRVFNHKD